MGDPSVDRLTIEGPFAATGSGRHGRRAERSSSANRPAPAQTKRPAPREILSTLARQAYRRPVDKATVDMLMDFYARGREA